MLAHIDGVLQYNLMRILQPPQSFRPARRLLRRGGLALGWTRRHPGGHPRRCGVVGRKAAGSAVVSGVELDEPLVKPEPEQDILTRLLRFRPTAMICPRKSYNFVMWFCTLTGESTGFGFSLRVVASYLRLASLPSSHRFSFRCLMERLHGGVKAELRAGISDWSWRPNKITGTPITSTGKLEAEVTWTSQTVPTTLHVLRILQQAVM